MADVRRLSAHVIKLRDMPEGVSALAQSSGSTTHPSLFVDDSDDGSDDDDDDDDDACVEIPLVTPLRSAVVIPSLGNQGGSFVAPAAEQSNTQDSQGKGIMVDDAAAPSVGETRPRPSSGPALSFRDVSCDAIHTDFFSFFVGPYYATYPKGGVARNCEFTREEWDAPYQPTFGVLTKEVFKDPAVCKTIVDQFPTPREMVRVESLSDDQLTAKMSVLHYMMMSYGGELLARYQLQVSTLKKQVSGLNDKLVSSDASFAKSKAKGKERTKKIKSLTKSLDSLHAKVARLSANLNRATVLEAEKDEEILRLKATPLDVGFEYGLSMHWTKDEFADVLKKMANFMHGAQDRLDEASPLDARVSPPIVKETTATPASKSLEFSTNAVPASSVVAFEQNEERVNVVIDGLDLEMTGGAAPSKSGSVFVQGTSHILDDFVKVAAVGSERVSSGPTDVVVALSVGEKGNGSLPSSAVDKEADVNPSGV
ncbi:hypothetical protein Tco_0688536 [Tanacetum coccineum]